MSEAINNFYLENGILKEITSWTDESDGKVIYEVLRIMNGKPLFYEEHYDRMINSFRLSNYDFKLSKDRIYRFILELVKSNNVDVGNIKITFNLKTEILRVFFIKHSYPTSDMYREGVKTILYFAERENPNAKIVNNSFRADVNRKLKETNSYEAILVDRNGYITEGSRSNIFLVKDNYIYTSKVEAVLPGVTRTEIIKVANNNGLNIIEENVRYTDICEFDVLFISGTSPNILPICAVNGEQFNVNNELLRRLMDLFSKEIEISISE